MLEALRWVDGVTGFIWTQTGRVSKKSDIQRRPQFRNQTFTILICITTFIFISLLLLIVVG